MKAVTEIIFALIFMIGVVAIPVWALNKIRSETLTKVSHGLTPLTSFTNQLIRK